jgi:histone-lysine N-methyltransferase SETMAR
LSPHFFGIKGPNYQRGVLLISAGAIEGHFEGKTPREGHQEGLVLATQKKLAYLGLQCLDHPPYSPDLAPSDYHLFPGLKKTIDAEVTAAAKTCLDGQYSEFYFLSGLQKLEQWAKKFIELRGEYFEKTRI